MPEKLRLQLLAFLQHTKSCLPRESKLFVSGRQKAASAQYSTWFVSKADTILSKTGQIAIQHIVVDNYDDFVRDAPSGYAVLKMELKMQEILLRFAEQIKGSIVMQGNGRFALYSTRGCLEEATGGIYSDAAH